MSVSFAYRGDHRQYTQQHLKQTTPVDLTCPQILTYGSCVIIMLANTHMSQVFASSSSVTSSVHTEGGAQYFGPTDYSIPASPVTHTQGGYKCSIRAWTAYENANYLNGDPNFYSRSVVPHLSGKHCFVNPFVLGVGIQCSRSVHKLYFGRIASSHADRV
jgi:hypothetical protein